MKIFCVFMFGAAQADPICKNHMSTALFNEHSNSAGPHKIGCDTGKIRVHKVFIEKFYLTTSIDCIGFALTYTVKAIWKNYQGNPCMSDVTSKLRQTCDGQKSCELPLGCPRERFSAITSGNLPEPV